MHVRELTTVEDLEALRPEWWDLWERCPQATPFQSPAWMLPWWRHVFGGGRVWGLELRSEARLVGLAQFYFYGAPRPRRLTLAGAGVTDYLDVLMEPDWAARVTAAIWECIQARSGDWDDFDFPDLRESSPLLAGGAAREPFACCPVVPLPAEAPAPYARRARKRLEGRAELEMNRLKLMDDLFRLHAALWEARNEPGVTAAPALQRHYRDAAGALFERGLLRLYGLRIEGEIAAVLFAFAGHGRTYAYLDGFDPRFAKRSPGTVLLAISMERAAAEGMREFDFLRKREQFKYEWGARDQATYRIAGRSGGLSVSAA